MVVTGPWFHCLIVSAGTLRSAADMGYTVGDCDQAVLTLNCGVMKQTEAVSSSDVAALTPDTWFFLVEDEDD